MHEVLSQQFDGFQAAFYEKYEVLIILYYYNMLCEHAYTKPHE